VRPTKRAIVSTPLTWDEVEQGVAPEDFRMDNVRRRFGRTGDLWNRLLQKTRRTNLTEMESYAA
jgi:bifunctional non-homologous end joining protein LigD